MSNDEKFMMRAIELAKRGEGLTRPNPPVGAVLVRGGKIIAEGWHKRAGGPHAEVNCLKAWSRERGAGSLKTATLYVTLEPCSTHGRTPPCTDLILEKGIGRVVVSVRDLNPKHAGRGLRILRRAGIEVVSNVCKKEGRELIAPFEKFITTGLPYVTLKLASTLDGRIADRKGDSKWITGPVARKKVQEMRRRADAIMVGAATVRADDPSLLPRPAKGRKPYRVIIGSDIAEDSKVLSRGQSYDLMFSAEETRKKTLNYRTDPYSDPYCDPCCLREVLGVLAAEYDVMHVLCEGGGKLAAGLVEAGLVDEFAFFIAPKLLGADGVPNFGKTGGLISNVRNLKFQSLEQVGEDLLIKAKLNHG